MKDERDQLRRDNEELHSRIVSLEHQRAALRDERDRNLEGWNAEESRAGKAEAERYQLRERVAYLEAVILQDGGAADWMKERDTWKSIAESKDSILTGCATTISRYEAALERIADPEVLDANWREMREVARGALSEDRR